jgi:hypothetical protein
MEDKGTPAFCLILMANSSSIFASDQGHVQWSNVINSRQIASSGGTSVTNATRNDNYYIHGTKPPGHQAIKPQHIIYNTLTPQPKPKEHNQHSRYPLSQYAELTPNGISCCPTKLCGIRQNAHTCALRLRTTTT